MKNAASTLMFDHQSLWFETWVTFNILVAFLEWLIIVYMNLHNTRRFSRPYLSVRNLQPDLSVRNLVRKGWGNVAVIL